LLTKTLPKPPKLPNECQVKLKTAKSVSGNAHKLRRKKRRFLTTKLFNLVKRFNNKLNKDTKVRDDFL